MKSKSRKISIMGIVNLTPDSFYDGSRFLRQDGLLDERCLLQAVQTMLDAGADIIDLGPCSSRPGSVPVSEQEEWRRLEPALMAVKLHFPQAEISVDTFRSGIVARAAGIAGHFVVNDISAGEDDAAMLDTVVSHGLGYVAMHKRGTPASMQGLCDYDGGVTAAVADYFSEFRKRAALAGLEDWWLDPGICFAKTKEQCWELVRGLEAFGVFERPLLVGLSRKSFLKTAPSDTPEMLLDATSLAHLTALEHGADILRVHDVAEAVRTVKMWRSL